MPEKNRYDLLVIRLVDDPADPMVRVAEARTLGPSGEDLPATSATSALASVRMPKSIGSDIEPELRDMVAAALSDAGISFWEMVFDLD